MIDDLMARVFEENTIGGSELLELLAIVGPSSLRATVSIDDLIYAAPMTEMPVVLLDNYCM